MGIPIPVEAKLDERSATAAANRAERVFAEAGKKAGQQFSSGFNVDGVEQDLKKIGDKASDSYDRARDAAGKLRAEEEKLQALRERGARNDQVVAQAERVEKARRAEVRAIRDATNAYEEYERAAESAGRQSGESFTSGLSGARAGAATAGAGWADSFAGGFAGSSALGNLPVSLMKGGIWVTAGILAGKLFGNAVADGMATLQMQDVFQGRMGLDEASMAQYANAAGAAFANNWGASVADNLATAQVALQAGIIDTGATEAEVQSVIEQLQGMAMVTDATAAELSRSVTTMMRTGMAGSVSEASDIIVAGFQNGLDVSGDWLDTINEYSTQFRKLGLDAGQVLTLLSQGMEGGARDTDKVADSLKEFSIRAIDGSKATREGFEALGFNADEMGRRFAAGGDQASVALSAVLTALRNIEDPMQQGLIWTRLFGTQFEDMGDAINQFDLSSVSTEFRNLEGTSADSTKTATDNFKSEWETATRTVGQYFADLKTSLADWATSLPIIRDIPNAITNMFGGGPQLTSGAPGVPAIVAPTTTPGGVQGPGIVTGGPAVAPPGGGNAVQNPLLAPYTPGGLPAPTVVTPASPSAPVQGPQIPILTDAQAEAQKEAEKAAGAGGSLPAAPVLPMQYAPTAGLPSNVASAQARIDELRHTLAEKQARVQQLESGNLGTAEDNQKARNEVVKAEQDLAQAERSMHDTRMKSLESQTKQLQQVDSSMSELGAALDSDFGISKGLPGLVDNLVRAIGAIAAAPLTGPLSAIASAHGDEGSGLMGMLASTGALGSRFMPGRSSVGGGYGYAPMGGSGGAPTEAQVKQIAAAFGLSVTSEDRPGDPGYHGQGMALDIGIPGMSTNDPRKAAFAQYMAQNFGGSLKELIYNDPNFTGPNINNGQPHQYSPGTMADHRDHVHVAAAWGSGAASPISSSASGGGPVPVNVVNGSTMLSGFNWDAVAAKESSGNWQNADTGNNGHYGGLQFSPSTWNAFGGQEFAPMPHLATREQQMAVADRTAFTGYNGTSPQGLGAWEVITNGSTAADGITVNSRPPFGGGGGLLPGAGMPQSAVFGGGIPGLPAVGSGGGAAGQPLGSPYPGQGGGEGGIGLGGMALDGIMAATSGLDMMAPGAGAAAKIGIQLANRTAKYAGQVAGIATEGVLQTFDVSGGNPKASLGNSWFGKLIGGIAGAAPAIPNVAGKAAAPPNPNDPNAAAQGQGGNTINQNVTLNNNHATEDMAGNQAVRELGAMYSAPGVQ